MEPGRKPWPFVFVGEHVYQLDQAVDGWLLVRDLSLPERAHQLDRFHELDQRGLLPAFGPTGADGAADRGPDRGV
jgi:hypothetical protein